MALKFKRLVCFSPFSRNFSDKFRPPNFTRRVWAVYGGGGQSINQSKPVTNRRRWGTPTDASAVIVAHRRLSSPTWSKRKCAKCQTNINRQNFVPEFIKVLQDANWIDSLPYLTVHKASNVQWGKSNITPLMILFNPHHKLLRVICFSVKKLLTVCTTQMHKVKEYHLKVLHKTELLFNGASTAKGH